MPLRSLTRDIPDREWRERAVLGIALLITTFYRHCPFIGHYVSSASADLGGLPRAQMMALPRARDGESQLAASLSACGTMLIGSPRIA